MGQTETFEIGVKSSEFDKTMCILIFFMHLLNSIIYFYHILS